MAILAIRPACKTAPAQCIWKCNLRGYTGTGANGKYRTHEIMPWISNAGIPPIDKHCPFINVAKCLPPCISPCRSELPAILTNCSTSMRSFADFFQPGLGEKTPRPNIRIWIGENLSPVGAFAVGRWQFWSANSAV